MVQVIVIFVLLIALVLLLVKSRPPRRSTATTTFGDNSGTTAAPGGTHRFRDVSIITVALVDNLECRCDVTLGDREVIVTGAVVCRQRGAQLSVRSSRSDPGRSSVRVVTASGRNSVAAGRHITVNGRRYSGTKGQVQIWHGRKVRFEGAVTGDITST